MNGSFTLISYIGNFAVQFASIYKTLVSIFEWILFLVSLSPGTIQLLCCKFIKAKCEKNTEGERERVGQRKSERNDGETCPRLRKINYPSALAGWRAAAAPALPFCHFAYFHSSSCWGFPLTFASGCGHQLKFKVNREVAHVRQCHWHTWCRLIFRYFPGDNVTHGLRAQPNCAAYANFL